MTLAMLLRFHLAEFVLGLALAAYGAYGLAIYDSDPVPPTPLDPVAVPVAALSQESTLALALAELVGGAAICIIVLRKSRGLAG